MNPLILLGILVWIYLLSVLKRSGITSFYFLLGSVGLFFIIIALSKPYIVWLLTQAVINGINTITGTMGMTHSFVKYGILYISNPGSPVTMSIDYECSGIIESAAFIGLVTFYPVYARKEKLFYSLMGVIYIYLANIIRIFIVVVLVHFGGSSVFFMAHSIIGRIIFYCLVIILYYNVFTYSQVSQSKGLYERISLKKKRKGNGE